jgi:hypothetical protein
MSRYPISLDRPVGNSEDSHFGDLLPDSGAESPAIGAAQEMLRGQISKVLKTLSYREREIIKLRYGLGDGYSYTLEEVGHIFKVTSNISASGSPPTTTFRFRSRGAPIRRRRSSGCSRRATESARCSKSAAPASTDRPPDRIAF